MPATKSPWRSRREYLGSHERMGSLLFQACTEQQRSRAPAHTPRHERPLADSSLSPGSSLRRSSGKASASVGTFTYLLSAGMARSKKETARHPKTSASCDWVSRFPVYSQRRSCYLFRNHAIFYQTMVLAAQSLFLPSPPRSISPSVPPPPVRFRNLWPRASLSPFVNK